MQDHHAIAGMETNYDNGLCAVVEREECASKWITASSATALIKVFLKKVIIASYCTFCAYSYAMLYNNNWDLVSIILFLKQSLHNKSLVLFS